MKIPKTVIVPVSLVAIVAIAAYLRDGKLIRDTTPEGWAIKIALLLIALSVVAFAFTAIFKGKSSAYALRSATKGISQGLVGNVGGSRR